MPDRTQDLKNLRAVATACKNYTDTKVKQEIDNLKWELGTYDLDIASDNTTALVKTMPSGTIMANVNKIKGASEVSENLIPKEKLVATSTYQGITITNNNDGSITLNGTYTGGEGAGFKIVDNLSIPAGSYAIAYFNNKVSTGANDIFRFNAVNDAAMNIGYLGSTTNLTATKTISVTVTSIWLRCSLNTTFDNIIIKPMLVKGSTAPTEWKQGFSGIHNLESISLDIEGANIAPLNNEEYERTFTNQYSVGVIPFTNTINIENGKTYSYSIKIKGNGTSRFNKIAIATNSSNNILESVYTPYIQASTTYTTLTFTFTATSDNVGYGIWLQTVDANATFTFKEFVLNYGSTVLDYVPYIQPTTISVDLTTIEDSGGNKLFADGKLRENDYITPNKASKGRTYINDLSQQSYTYFSGTSVSTGGLHWIVFGNSVLANATNVISNMAFEPNANAGLASTTPILSIATADNITTLRYYTTKTTAQEALAELSGIFIEYNITPKEANIDFSFLKNIQGYSNGSITAQNTYDMAVPSEIDYLIEEVKE